MTSQIAKFYAGRSVFLTGGSGFLGKQLVEKLLRSCPEIDSIYLLMRAKKGDSVQQRLNQTLESPVFDVLRERQPNFKRKVIPVVGDVLHDFLGISDADHSRMSSNVSIAVHSAATLSFIEPMRVAVDTNVLGTRRALNVAKQLPKIESMIYISTAYSQVDKLNEVIEEKVYDLATITPEKLIEMTRLMDDDELAAITPHLLRREGRPNTYTLTKAIAEKLIQEERGQCPVCIVRPSIVTASVQEPFPGWVDNVVAANGIYAAFGTGTVRSIYTHSPNTQIDNVPVDRVINAIIAAAWHNATSRSSTDEVPVYNITTDLVHRIDVLTTYMGQNARQFPYSKLHPARYTTGYPFWSTNWLIYRYLHEVYLPLKFGLFDLFLSLTGNKPRLTKMFNKSKQLADVLHFFATNSFRWSYDRLDNVYSQMSPTDKKEFNCRFNDINLQTYYADWWQGMKKHVFKDPAILNKQQSKQLQLSQFGPTLQPNGIANSIHQRTYSS